MRMTNTKGCFLSVAFLAIVFLGIPIGCTQAIHWYNIQHLEEITPEAYPAWMAAHPEVKSLTKEQWQRLYREGLLKYYK